MAELLRVIHLINFMQQLIYVENFAKIENIGRLINKIDIILYITGRAGNDEVISINCLK